MTNNSENNEVKQNKNRKRLLITVASAVCVLVIAAVLMTQVIMPNNKYNEAVNLLESGEYLQAIDLFTELGGHKDSKTKNRECEYQMAISMMENGHYEEAISIFQNLTGYKDSLDKINECNINMETGEIDTLYSRAVELMNNGMYEEALTSFEAISAAKDCSGEIVQCRKMQILSYKVGDTFCLGNYEQDGSGGTGDEPIEWIILANDGERVFAISKKAIDARPQSEHPNWEDSELRNWLINDFQNEAFSEEELAVLAEDEYGDKVSIFSFAHIRSGFFNTIDIQIKRCEPTVYTESRGVVGRDYHGLYCDWWVRSFDDDTIPHIDEYGELSVIGIHRSCGVRPVIWIDVRTD